MQRPEFQKFCFGFVFMGWKQKLQISFSRKNGKGSESKPGNFMKNEKDWFMRTLGCQLSPSPDIFLVGWPLRCLEGMGAVFTSHFPLCSFRQWTGALGPEAEVFLPTPCHFALPWLLWIQHFLALVGQANLTLSHNMAASVYCLHSLTSTFLAQFLTELKDQLYLWGCRMWGKYNTLFIFILLL